MGIGSDFKNRLAPGTLWDRARRGTLRIVAPPATRRSAPVVANAEIASSIERFAAGEFHA